MDPNSSSCHRVFNDENLLTEILIRIPTKPLVRSKCVCKQWNSIVSSDPFSRILTRFQTTNSQTTSGVFITALMATDFGGLNYRYHYLSLPASSTPPAFNLRFSFKEPELVQSCNGLLLFSEGELESKKTNRMCVYNPATHQFKKLPSLILSRRGPVLGITLAFDPLRFQGFKVVCLTTSSKNDFAGGRRIMSYCSSDGVGDSGGSWKKWEGNLLDLPYDVGFDKGLYWKGLVHWITLRGDSVYYDVENEKLGRFPSPPISPDKVGFCGLYELDGNLHYLNGPDPHDSPQECKVYEFSGYEQGWILKYNVNASEMVISASSQGSGYMAVYTPAKHAITCLVTCEEEEEKKLVLLAHLRDKMSAYDLKKGTQTTLFVDATFKQWFGVYPYTASLALF